MEGTPEPQPKPTPFERWIWPYVQDSTLWPTLLVAAGAVVSFVAPVILLAVRDRWMPAMGAIAGLALLTTFATFEEWSARRRLGAQTALIAVAWGLCIGGAFLADHYGVF